MQSTTTRATRSSRRRHARARRTEAWRTAQEMQVLTWRLKELLGIGAPAAASASASAAPVTKTAEQLTTELKTLLGIGVMPPTPPPSPAIRPSYPPSIKEYMRELGMDTRCIGCYHEDCAGECGVLWCGCIDVCRGRCGLNDLHD